MADRIIDNPIINSPYRAPEKHFRFDDEGITNEIVPGRRPSQYFIPIPRPRKRGQQIELDFAEFTADKIRKNDFVNEVRARVDLWRKPCCLRWSSRMPRTAATLGRGRVTSTTTFCRILMIIRLARSRVSRCAYLKSIGQVEDLREG